MGSTPSPTPDVVRTTYPSLIEVLSRRTRAPLDLFSFYIYMRDQQRSVDYLDFWLDVSQHMSLCRHYVRELRRSVLVDTPELEKAASKRSSAVLDNLEGEAGPSEKRTEEQRLSAFLRSDNGSRHSPHSSQGSNQTTPSGERPPRPAYIASPSQNNSPATGDSSTPGAHSASPQHTVSRQDIRNSAVKILYTYLLPGAEREIILPAGINNAVTQAIEQEGRDDPEVFDAAKDYVFQAMERDAYPGFLRSKALGNLVPPSIMLRLILGLLSLFAGFWTGFILIFLDYSRRTRCWLILPFTLGVYFLVTHQFMLDPILALLGFSEYTFMSFNRVREPFVRNYLHWRRSWMALAFIVVIDAALCVLFIFVPGKRL